MTQKRYRPLSEYRRKIEAAEADLWPLCRGEKVDLLLDNFLNLDIEDAEMILGAIEKDAAAQAHA